MIEVSIIIVNWNSGELLKNSIKSIKNSTFNHFETIVIDNDSKDNSINFLESYSNDVKLIQNKKNIGFGAACNQGIIEATGRYILFLNPDAMVYKSTLKDCIDFMDLNKGIGILGVKLIDENNLTSTSCSRFPKFKNYFFDSIGLSKFFPKLFKPSTMMNDWNHESSMEVDQVMGAFMFCRKDLFETIGLFDECFFVYYEDMDLSIRAKKAGYKIFYNSNINAYHKGRGTTDQIKDIRLFYSIKSRLFFAKKHLSKLEYLLIKLNTFSLELVSRIVFTGFKHGFTGINQVIKGYKLFLKK